MKSTWLRSMLWIFVELQLYCLILAVVVCFVVPPANAMFTSAAIDPCDSWRFLFGLSFVLRDHPYVLVLFPVAAAMLIGKISPRVAKWIALTTKVAICAFISADLAIIGICLQILATHRAW